MKQCPFEDEVQCECVRRCEKWIKRGPAAKVIGRSRQTVSNLVLAGKVRSIQPGGELTWRLFFLPDLEKFKPTISKSTEFPVLPAVVAVFDSNQ